MAKKFKELLNQKSKGKLDVQIYTDGQLGGQTENCDGLRSGAVDLTIVDTGTIANYYPQFGIFDMPYVFTSRDQAIAVTKTDVAKTLSASATKATEMRPLLINAIAYRYTFLKNKDIKNPEDLKGVKVRIPDTPSIKACFQALGATPVAMPSGEAYTAVQTGVTDGLEGNFEFVAQQKYYEVAPRCSLTQHVMTFTTLCMSEKVYQALSAEDKKAVDAAAAESLDYFYSISGNIENKYKKVLEEHKVTFTNVDIKACQAKCKPILEKFVNDNKMKDIFDKIESMAK